MSFVKNSNTSELNSLDTDIKVPPHYKSITAKAKNLAITRIKLSKQPQDTKIGSKLHLNISLQPRTGKFIRQSQKIRRLNRSKPGISMFKKNKIDQKMPAYAT